MYKKKNKLKKGIFLAAIIIFTISKIIFANATPVIINEIMYNPYGNDNNKEYIELKDIELFEISDEYSQLNTDNFLGIAYQEQGDYTQLPNSPTKVSDANDFRYYDYSNKLIYAPLPTTLKDDMIKDLTVNSTSIQGLTNSTMFKLSLDSLIFITQQISDSGVVIFSSNSNLAYAHKGNFIKLNLVEPSTNKVLSYTREVTGTNTYTHKYYVDNKLVNSKTNSNLPFVKSDQLDIPI
jgi:hypothetical protein